jgi:tRNA G18 (ribose-2'-O)-methylase SpoU
VYAAEQAVLDAVVGFHFHRGVLASAQRLPLPQPEALLAGIATGARRIVICEALTNHDNVGGVFRNAAAFGADAVLLDQRSCDPLYRKAVRVSVGGALTMPYARAERAIDLVRAAQNRGFLVVALSPRADAIDVGALRIPERVALLVGSEGPGLDAATMEAADIVARIPIEPRFDSLNVSTASGIALYVCRVAQHRSW